MAATKWKEGYSLRKSCGLYKMRRRKETSLLSSGFGYVDSERKKA